MPKRREWGYLVYESKPGHPWKPGTVHRGARRFRLAKGGPGFIPDTHEYQLALDSLPPTVTWFELVVAGNRAEAVTRVERNHAQRELQQAESKLRAAFEEGAQQGNDQKVRDAAVEDGEIDAEGRFIP